MDLQLLLILSNRLTSYMNNDGVPPIATAVNVNEDAGE